MNKMKITVLFSALTFLIQLKSMNEEESARNLSTSPRTYSTVPLDSPCYSSTDLSSNSEFSFVDDKTLLSNQNATSAPLIDEKIVQKKSCMSWLLCDFFCCCCTTIKITDESESLYKTIE